MDQVIIIYVVCENAQEAKKIGEILLKEKLCACTNIIPAMQSMFFLPPNSEKIAFSEESILLIKTLENYYSDIEKKVLEKHSYEIPAIFSIKVDQVSLAYYQWMKQQF